MCVLNVDNEPTCYGTSVMCEETRVRCPIGSDAGFHSLQLTKLTQAAEGIRKQYVALSTFILLSTVEMHLIWLLRRQKFMQFID